MKRLGFSALWTIVAILAVIILGGGAYWYLTQSSSGPTYDTEAVVRIDLTETISVTGRIQAARDVDLAFNVSGRVAEVLVDEGDTVAEDDALVVLDTTSLDASLAEAEATLAVARASRAQYRAAVTTAQAELEERRRGTRPEELAIADSKVDRARQTVVDARRDLATVTNQADVDLSNIINDAPDVLNDAFRTADDAVYEKTNALFIETSGTPQLSYTTAAAQAELDAELGRVAAEGALVVLSGYATSAPTEPAAVSAALSDAEVRLAVVRDFLNDLSTTLSVSNSLSSGTRDTYQTNVNTARTNMNTAIASVRTKAQEIAAQRATNQRTIDAADAAVSDASQALLVAEDELRLLEAGTTAEQITAAEARLEQAEANVVAQDAEIVRARAAVDRAAAALADATIRAPFAGIVTSVSVTSGEIVSTNTAAVSVISSDALEIVANVPEADIALLAVGQEASAELDAYAGERLPVMVQAIDPAATILDGVVTYRTTLRFAEQDERVRAGLTADVEITAATSDGALAVPLRAVTRTDMGPVLSVLRGGVAEEVGVTLGIRDDRGFVEVLTGIEEGVLVVTGERES